MTSNGDTLSYITANTTAISSTASKPATQLDNKKTQFRNTMAKYISFPEESGTGAKVSAKTVNYSTHQLLEKMRVDTSAMRLQLITALLRKDEEDNKQYDTHRKCLDIARRIMRGKKVSAGEMRFLLQNDPGLYFMAILFRKTDSDSEENDRDFDDLFELSDESSVAGAGATANATPAGSSAPGADAASAEEASAL